MPIDMECVLRCGVFEIWPSVLAQRLQREREREMHDFAPSKHAGSESQLPNIVVVSVYVGKAFTLLADWKKG
jgi:hypothetical protein